MPQHWRRDSDSLSFSSPLVRLYFLLPDGSRRLRRFARRRIFYSSSISAFKAILMHHEAVSSVRSNVFCVHDIWLLRLLFNFSIAKLRQDVYLKYRLGYLHHKNIGNLPHFPRMTPGKEGIPTFLLKIICFLHFPCSLSRSIVKIFKNRIQ